MIGASLAPVGLPIIKDDFFRQVLSTLEGRLQEAFFAKALFAARWTEMLVPFLIMLREGVEAALIVGIIASYLQPTGRGAWMPVVWIGIFLAVALSLIVGAVAAARRRSNFRRRRRNCSRRSSASSRSRAHLDGVLDAQGGALDQGASCSIDRRRRSPRRAAEGSALIAMVFLAVAREGVELVFFLLADLPAEREDAAPLGALARRRAAPASSDTAIYAGSVRIDLRRFFRWTGAFILIVAAGLLAERGATRCTRRASGTTCSRPSSTSAACCRADSPLGSVLGGIFGYIDAPTVERSRRLSRLPGAVTL
ncbi:MAG: FTR1 family protein [Solirubrobacterales bacterium]